MVLEGAAGAAGQLVRGRALSRAQVERIEGQAAVDQANLKAQAVKIESESELVRLSAARNAELLSVIFSFRDRTGQQGFPLSY